jgi:hypothetical protein
MKLSVILPIFAAGLVLSTSASALPACRASTCDGALQKCIAYRNGQNLSSSALNCEASAAKCRSTGIWRGKFMPRDLAGGCSVQSR